MGRHSNAKRAELAAQAARESAVAESQQRTEPQESQDTQPQTVPAERPKVNNGREAYDEVVARHEQDLTPPEEKLTVEPKVEAPKETPKEDVSQEPAQPETAPVEAIAPAETAKVKIKVDGEEIEVTQEQVDEAGSVRALQREMAADNRLKKAKEALEETRRNQSLMVELLQRQQTPKEPEITDEQFIASKVDVIRFGTQEESAAALREVLQRSSQKVDPQAISRQILGEVERKQAVNGFAKEFEDIAANPLLLRLAMSLEAERVTKGPVEDWPRFYRSIGNEVRSVVRPSQPSNATEKTTDTPSTGSDKEARKASIVNLPTAAARAELPKETKPESREDIINQMKEARGIPSK